MTDYVISTSHSGGFWNFCPWRDLNLTVQSTHQMVQQPTGLGLDLWQTRNLEDLHWYVVRQVARKLETVTKYILKRLPFFLGIIICFSIGHKLEIRSLAPIPMAGLKFPMQRVSPGNGSEFLQGGISVMRFCKTDFSLHQVSQLISFKFTVNLTLSVLRHREDTLFRCLIRHFRWLVIQDLSCLRQLSDNNCWKCAIQHANL